MAKKKNDSKGLKIERLVQTLACPIKTPNTIKFGISKKNLKHLDKMGFENSELEILEGMQNYSIK